MSESRAKGGRGSSSPADLSEDQLSAAPALTSVDALVIEALVEDEDEAFAAALDS